MATFTTPPDFASQLTESPRVLEAQFGDAYMQRIGDGINIRPQVWQLKFSVRTNAERDTILAFLRAENGITSFDWTPPGGTAGKYICKEWNYTPDSAATNTITATFSQVFGE
jgi:phage-related protein